MLVFIKLGGSLITDKRVEASFRLETMKRIAGEIMAGLELNPSLRLIIGHGSGSFGHFAASRFGTIDGVQSPDQWIGFAEVAAAAAELNHRVAGVLRGVGLPIIRMQPSASGRCVDGQLVEMATHPVERALANGLIPLVYGDVALDDVRGGTIISTETILTYLAKQLQPQQIILLGEVDGVYDAAGEVIPEITRENAAQYESVLGGSDGRDVTGGMLTKVRDMLALTETIPDLGIHIANGQTPGLLSHALSGKTITGTLIRR